MLATTIFKAFSPAISGYTCNCVPTDLTLVRFCTHHIQRSHPVLKEIIIYTDGACSGNPGPGGWAALLRHGEHQKVVSGGERMTTNNRMELTAALEALRALKQPCKVSLHTDSAYLHNAFTQGWLDKWQRNGWKTSSKKPVENKDLWEALLNVSERHDVSWVKVKGHADDEMNNLVDEVAVAAMEEYKM